MGATSSMPKKHIAPVSGTSIFIQPTSPYTTIGQSNMWDMSSSELLGDELEVKFRWNSDSTFSAATSSIRRDYLILGDTLFRVCEETHFGFMNDSIACVVDLLNAKSGEMVEKHFKRTGREYTASRISENGISSVKSLGYGTLALPTGTTIDNVSLHVNRRVSDTVGDTIDIYVWRADNTPFPIAMTKISRGITTIAETWICDPTKMPISALGAEGLVSMSRNIKAIGGPDGEYNGGKAKPVVEYNDGIVIVKVSSSDFNDDLSLLLTDSMGRVVESSKSRTIICNVMEASISVGGLPSGEYLLYVHFDGITSVEKIINR